MTAALNPETKQRLKRRHAAERRFRFYGITAIAVALGALIILLGNIVMGGASAFITTELRLTVQMDAAVIDPERTGKRDEWRQANYAVIVLKAPAQLTPFAAAVGGVVLALMNIGKPKDGDS